MLKLNNKEIVVNKVIQLMKKEVKGNVKMIVNKLVNDNHSNYNLSKNDISSVKAITVDKLVSFFTSSTYTIGSLNEDYIFKQVKQDLLKISILSYVKSLEKVLKLTSNEIEQTTNDIYNILKENDEDITYDLIGNKVYNFLEIL